MGDTQQLEELLLLYLTLLYKGKVRDTYAVPGHPELLLVVASDRISIFDFILNAVVRGKGEVLTAMNIFWRRKLRGYEHDLVAFGTQIDLYLPEALRGNTALQRRAVIVAKLDMFLLEGVVRGFLTGSGLISYRETRTVCGHKLPMGLSDGSQLPEPIFTPTTKATEGHDEHITFQSVADKYGLSLEVTCLDIYKKGARYAREECGIIIADTKIELGHLHGEISKSVVVADEVLTPDSSRFWDRADWEQAHRAGRMPKSFDKQFVRDYGKLLGIDKRNPKNSADYEWVRQQRIPEELLAQTGTLYQEIFKRLAKEPLDQFWARHLVS